MRFTLFPFLGLLVTTIASVSLAFEGFQIESFTSYPVDKPVRQLKIISTADTELFAPLVLAFQQKNPQIAIEYTTVSSSQLMQAISVEGAPFDVAISSAMDLQTKLANDGFTRAYRSDAANLLPEWGRWRDHVFSFTQEPAAIVISPDAFSGLQIPKNRQDLITVLRNNPNRFKGRVGTYDVRSSGLGYLFATQDARTSETYWRLSEVMGSLGTQLYCCSSDMIEDVASGKIAVAYNVLGSYALARKDLAGKIEIIAPADFTTLMLRTAVIPTNAQNPDLAGDFIDHLILSALTEAGASYYPFPKLVTDTSATFLRPIRLGPGLLVFLDDLKRRRFLQEWEAAVLQ
ncbi:MAG: ABC transporter substrate-binding protein [Devosiaceae bacterium]|nr:ABC transporter substrate-binding protein [Devosiaceae bacterium]